MVGLLGMHGQGLVWTAFMERGVMVQVCPSGCNWQCENATSCYNALAGLRNVTHFGVVGTSMARRRRHRKVIKGIGTCDDNAALPPHQLRRVLDRLQEVLGPIAAECARRRYAAA